MRAASFLAGVVIGIAMLALSVFLYFRFGWAPVATSAPPMLFEQRLARAALRARINREMPKAVPIEPSEATLTAGAQLYQKDCAVCHGLPNRPPSNVAKGMFPKPPQLFVDTVTDDPPGKIYWKTKNGIRLTGMPAFGSSLSETELWQVSLMLQQADKLPDPARAVLQGAALQGAPGTQK